jgi:hypothetical protein
MTNDLRSPRGMKMHSVVFGRKRLESSSSLVLLLVLENPIAPNKLLGNRSEDEGRGRSDSESLRRMNFQARMTIPERVF